MQHKRNLRCSLKYRRNWKLELRLRLRCGEHPNSSEQRSYFLTIRQNDLPMDGFEERVYGKQPG
jgi:hypothetical protein